MKSFGETTGHEIAVIGMAGRLPGARSLDEFWQNLCDGRESVRFFSHAELAAAGISPTQYNDPRYVPARAVLDDIALFDAGFFGLTPREAELMDPQQRLFIECAWHALEDAGHAAVTAGTRIGVFGSASLSTYLMHNLYTNREVVDSAGVSQIMLGNNRDFLSTQVSYRLNLSGPALAVQTACSSSLVAVHLACQSLIAGECDIALVGGVSVVVPQAMGYVYQEGGVSSPDGHMHPFDHRAKGMVNGEGVGIAVLRRLDDALRARDTVRAVIRGSAVNNDGANKLGYTAPSVAGQAEVVRDALAVAAVDPASIGYVEAHGTGTLLGDPIEIAALNEAFRTPGLQPGSCAIGSVKGNIGHLESAAGIAGLIKVVLMLEHRRIPPSIHFEQPNPEIDFASGPFFVNDRLRTWGTGAGPRCAGVSSFGFGGTNAHVVLEEAPLAVTAGTSRTWQLLPISARTTRSLDEATNALGRFLREAPELSLADVAYTLGAGRRAFPRRRTLLVPTHDAAGAAAALETLDRTKLTTHEVPALAPRVVFMFSGQGAQYPGMARDLHESEPQFRDVFDQCATLLEPHLSLDLREVVFAPAGPAATARLTQTALAQPVLFSVEYALVQLWQAWGLRPDAMLGHSIGEYVAACVAGVMPLPDALAAVAERGRLMQALPQGAMLAVQAAPEAVAPLLHLGLSLAAVNGLEACVLSGPADAVARAEEQLGSRGVRHQRLQTSHAFHSAMMTPAVVPFVSKMSRIELSPPSIPFVSNISGDWIVPVAATDPAYWGEHIRRPVRFAASLDTVTADTPCVLLEIGPGEALAGLARAHLEVSDEHTVISSLPRARDPSPALKTLLRAAGELWCRGINLDWDGIFAGRERRRVSVPGYAFDHQHYWIDPPAAATVLSPGARVSATTPAALPTKSPNVRDWFWLPAWRETPPAAPDFATVASQAGPWLLFALRGPAAEAIAGRLRSAGQSVITVAPGAGFARRGTEMYSIDPAAPGNFEALLADLRDRDCVPHIVLHCWHLDEAPSPPGADAFEHAQALGLHSLTALARAFSSTGRGRDLRVVVASTRLNDVSGIERVWPERATLLAACMTWQQEQPNVTCSSVDFVLPASGAPEDQLVGQLLTEALASPPDREVAYRGSHRWTRSFVPAPIDSASPEEMWTEGSGQRDNLRGSWRAGGVYVIIGGLGRVGLLVAEHLARNVQARLVLIGRTTVPARDAWQAWLDSHAGAGAMSARIRRLQAIEALGGEVQTVAADASDDAAMRDALAQAEARFGGIDAVLYAATAPQSPTDDGLLAALARSEVEAHFRAKVRGVQVLDRAIAERELDFCLLFSSISTVLGGIGLTAYAAANLYIDAFAASRNGQTPWLTVDWDVWPDGAAGPNTSVHSSLDRYAMSEGEALDALDRALTRLRHQRLVVSTGDLPSRRALWLTAGGRSDAGAPADALSSHARPDVSTDYVAPATNIEATIAGIWETFLGFGPIGTADNFFELGGHSLLAPQIVARIASTCRVELPLSSLFEGPTVGDLANAVQELMAIPDATTTVDSGAVR